TLEDDRLQPLVGAAAEDREVLVPVRLLTGLRLELPAVLVEQARVGIGGDEPEDVAAARREGEVDDLAAGGDDGKVEQAGRRIDERHLVDRDDDALLQPGRVAVEIDAGIVLIPLILEEDVPVADPRRLDLMNP